MHDDAVTPVIGTVMILGITVLGIGSIMFWGAPTLQAIQDQNAVLAMQGEFIEVRTGTLDLMIDKSSRVPEIVVESGDLALEEGTRFLITSNQFEDKGAAYTGCTMVLTGWDDADGTFAIDKGTCNAMSTIPTACPAAANDLCLSVATAVGGNIDEESWTSADGGSTWDITLTDPDADLTQGDWVFTLYDDGADIAAQTWLLGTDRLSWELSTISGSYGVHLEGGAVFEVQGIRAFLVKSPAIQEDASGTGDFFLRIPTYIASDRGSVGGPVTAGVFIGQVGNNHPRIQSDATDSATFAFSGDLAEPWCRSLLARNTLLTTAEYIELTTDACDDVVPFVEYTRDDDGDGTDDPFPFELSHARITTRLQL